MEKGDIVLIPFPFTDLTGKKSRPALVLIDHDNDITVSFITSKINWREEFDFLIIAEEQNGLKKDSILRVGKITTLEKNLVIGKLGSISSTELGKIDGLLIKILKLKV